MIPILLTQADAPDDKEFLTEMFRNFSRLMYSTAGKYVNADYEKEDIVQEALVRLISKVDTLKKLQPKALVSYVVVTVKHTAINRLREAGSKDSRFTDIFEVTEELSGDEPDMDSRIILKENLGKLSDVWKELTEAEQFLLEGKYICGYTDAELAKTLGCKESSVRMKLTRARRHALDLLTKEGVTIE